MTGATDSVTDPVFDVCGPLPTGTTVLEASAGTGKTFTIAALAARYVAAGVPLDRLLLVTFTRLATGELRARVRDRLVSAERGLARVVAGGKAPADDAVLALLADAATAEVEARRRRLAAALSDFDAATIDTTHGFCRHILAGLGVAGDAGQGTDLVEDADDLVDEVVDDFYVRRFAVNGHHTRFSLDVARRIGRLAVRHPEAPVEPASAPADSDGDLRRRLAEAVRREVDRRKRQRGIVTYDDLLTRLAATLRDPVRGPAAAARLRHRYGVVLVDEFQDTDPIQWEILRRAFAGPARAAGSGPDGATTTLVLIGDPKQAIYAFRGADVHAYLDAARHAAHRATLATNWRADQGLVEAGEALLGGTRLGHDEIVHRTVHAPRAHHRPRLAGAPDAAPLRFRIVQRQAGVVELSAKGWAATAATRTHVAHDLAGDVAGLLAAGPTLVDRSPDGADTGHRPLRPGDVAVLVNTHRQGLTVRQALAAAGVPAVLGGGGNVFTTAEAGHWLTLLEALERPSSPTRAHTVALTPFLRWDAARVAGATDDEWEDVYARLHRWAAVLRQRGVASLVGTITAGEGPSGPRSGETGPSGPRSGETGLPARLLTRPDGERVLTDLRHVGELLHAEAAAAGLGVTALAGWLRRRIAGAPTDGSDEDHVRRLESDADAVPVLTVHRAKGLEFPVVYVPFLWEPGWIPDDDFPVFHDPDHDDRRTLDVGRGGRAFAEHRRRHQAELRGEDLRLAYVALTRARHQAVVWWASSWASRDSPLARLLLARDADGRVAAEGPRVPDEAEVAAWAGALAGTSVADTGVGADRPRATPGPPAGGLAARSFTRALDVDWRRTSYTAITAAVHGGAVAEEAEAVAPRAADEALAPGPGAEPDEGPTGGEPVPLASMPGGAAVGSVIHAVLEAADFTAADLDAELAGLLVPAAAREQVDVGDPAVTAAGLRRAVETPLGPLVGGIALRDVARADRLDELAFELPLAGGETVTGRALTMAAVAAELRARVPAGDALAGYADHLAAPELQRELRGYLNGSIDAVLRVGGRFVVVDYKTNRLAPPDEPLTADHYGPVALADAMQRAHYPLQALLYSVALHRYLRARLAGYDPETHLGGFLYLFVRGMTGRSGRHGVFGWRPPEGLVPALSDLLDEGDTP